MNELTKEALQTMTGDEAKLLVGRILPGTRLVVPLDWTVRRTGRDGVHHEAAALVIHGLRCAGDETADPEFRNLGALLAKAAADRLRDIESMTTMFEQVTLLADIIRQAPTPAPIPTLRLEIPGTRKIVERDDHGNIKAIVDEPA